MTSLNQVNLIGFVGQEPNIAPMNNGGEVCNFSLATTETWKDRDGQKKERTEWHNIVVFTPFLIDLCRNYVTKGSKLYVSGKLQVKRYQDKNGIDKQTTQIILTGFDVKLLLLSSENNNNSESDNYLDESVDW